MTHVYIGSAGTSEIIAFALDAASGNLSEIGTFAVPGITKAGGSIPMSVSPDRRFLYAGMRGEPLVVATFAIEPRSGKLAHVGNGPLADSMPYVTTDRTGRWLLSASYSGNKVAVNPIGSDGIVGPPKQVLPTPPNAHAIQIDKANRHVLVPCLGGDVIAQFTFDAATGTLTATAPTGGRTAGKAGPRHFRFSGDERFVYLLCELDATVYVFPYDARTGSLGKQLQILSALPTARPEKCWAAEIQLTPDGRFLYASERGSSTIAAYRVDAASGMLTPLGSTPTEQQPRSFQIDPSGRFLYALGEMSNHMTSYAIDARTGALTALKRYPAGKSPNWIELVATA